MDVAVVLSTQMLKEVVKQGHIDIVISDYHLGFARETGLEVLQYAKQIQLDKPPHCVLITGDTTLELTELVRNTDIHLQHKPMSPTQLRAFLNALLKNTHDEYGNNAA